MCVYVYVACVSFLCDKFTVLYFKLASELGSWWVFHQSMTNASNKVQSLFIRLGGQFKKVFLTKA